MSNCTRNSNFTYCHPVYKQNRILIVTLSSISNKKFKLLEHNAYCHPIVVILLLRKLGFLYNWTFDLIAPKM